MQKIVIIEDDKAIMNSLSDFLIAEGYTVYTAVGQKDGTRLIRECSPDCILLDISLPDGNGFSICSDVRRYSDVPVIFLTASGDEKSVIAGLELGADDYITKPFNPVEMLARVRSQIRRYTKLGGNTSVNNENLLTIGGISLNDASKIVTVDGEAVNLTPTEYEILKLLMQNKGRVMSQKEIYESVRNELAFGAGNTIAVHIRHLREKIEINPSEPRYIKVVWAHGYKFEG